MAAVTLKLKGRLGSAAAAKLETGFAKKAGALTEKGDKTIIDLQDLVYISSLGIRMLERWQSKPVVPDGELSH